MFSSFRQEQSKNILENQNKKVIKNKNTKEKNGSLQVYQTNKEKTVTGKKERRYATKYSDRARVVKGH